MKLIPLTVCTMRSVDEETSSFQVQHVNPTCISRAYKEHGLTKVHVNHDAWITVKESPESIALAIDHATRVVTNVDKHALIEELSLQFERNLMDRLRDHHKEHR